MTEKLAPPTPADKKVYTAQVRNELIKAFNWIPKYTQNASLNKNGNDYESARETVAQTLKDNLEKSEYARNSNYKDIIRPIIADLKNNDFSFIFEKDKK